MNPFIPSALTMRMQTAQDRYGSYASTHEALGVASEEWDEFRAAIQSNDLAKVEEEALDLAACLLRLVEQIGDDALRQRSTKLEQKAKTPVLESNLSCRIRNALIANDFEFVEDALALDDWKLRMMPSIGRKAIVDLREWEALRQRSVK